MDDLQLHSEAGLLMRLEKIQHFIDVERYDLAERMAREALAVHPEESMLHVQLAWALEGLGRADEAEREGHLALQLDPEESEAIILLAKLNLNAGRHREAEKLCLSALQLEPLAPRNYLIYGILMQKTGHLEKAEKLLRKCLEIAPETPLAHAVLSAILAEKRQGQAALAHGAHGVSLDPDSDYSHATLGLAYLTTGHPFKARMHLREALRIAPDDADMEAAFAEADRATRWIYLPMYFWSLWMERVPGLQFGFWIGMIVFLQVLRQMGVSSQIVFAIAMTYLAFCVYTWVATPLANLWIKIRPAR